MVATARNPYHSDFARRHFDRGFTHGMARGLLGLLDARGIEVPDELRDRIVNCSDIELRNAWVRRAVTANTAHDLFD